MKNYFYEVEKNIVFLQNKLLYLWLILIIIKYWK